MVGGARLVVDRDFVIGFARTGTGLFDVAGLVDREVLVVDCVDVVGIRFGVSLTWTLWFWVTMKERSCKMGSWRLLDAGYVCLVGILLMI